MNYIIRDIWLGNSQDSRDVLFKGVNPNGITAVLNVAKDLSIDPSGGGIMYVHRGLIDGSGNPEGALEEAIDALYDLSESGYKILIHCHEGVSRSPIVLACLLAKNMRLSLEQALVYIAAKRPVIYPKKDLIYLAREYCAKYVQE